MRLPDIWTTAEIDKHLDTVLKALDLSHIEHTIIGDENTRGVSGGQRKRVNIGMEIAAMPLCLCLDEPTSGLDSTAALEVADILRRMSELGMTVLAVIHQPRVEIFHKFDDVLLLAPGGRTAYLGPTKGTKPYFEGLGFKFAEGSNVADVLMDILSGVGVNTINPMNINQLVEEWAKKCLHESIEELDTKIDDEIFHSTVGDLISARGASFWKQLIYVHNLSLLQQFRKWPGLALEVFVGMLAGAIIGISVANLKEVFAGVWAYPYTLLSSAPIPDVIVQFILFTGMAVSMAAAPAGVKVYSEELTVYWRNAASGHSKLAYYIVRSYLKQGKFFSSIYRMILASVHFTAVLFFFSGVSTFVNQFFMVTFFFFGVYGVSNFVSMVVRRENATLLAVIITLFASVFCGYGLTIKDAKSSNIYFFWTTQFNMCKQVINVRGRRGLLLASCFHIRGSL
jgi:energy-coupling factor transporter ATP-binding protein EcfA2